jgi:DNA-binding IclR family transcriptional regulator
MGGFEMHASQNKLTSTQTNQSSDKLLNILETLSEQTEPLRLQDIARLCKMNASTTLRFLTALQHRNYVAQDAETARYYLTFKLCALAQNLTTFFDIRKAALPYLRNVAHVFAESCHLAVEDNMAVVYIEVVNANKTLMSTQYIGNMAPLHCTGVGKTFLADYTPAELEHYIAVKKLAAYTEYTLTDPKELKAELDRIRSEGYALDNQECEIGARCVAAPIRDYAGGVKAGISVSGPAVRMTDAHIFTHLPSLLEAAEQISARMGWRHADRSMQTQQP